MYLNISIERINIFSFIICVGKLAAAGCPRSRDELEYLAKQGVNQLVTLSRERRPPIKYLPNGMTWTEIPVEEFEPPTEEEIQIFINLCQQGELNGDVSRNVLIYLYY